MAPVRSQSKRRRRTRTLPVEASRNGKCPPGFTGADFLAHDFRGEEALLREELYQEWVREKKDAGAKTL